MVEIVACWFPMYLSSHSQKIYEDINRELLQAENEHKKIENIMTKNSTLLVLQCCI